MSLNLAADEQRVLAAAESVLGPLVAEGRARLDVSPAAGSRGALIEITPTRESACPVTIHCEAPGDLDLYVGRYKLTTHIWKTREWERGDFAALEAELSDWLTALIEGRYQEEVRLTHDGDAGKGRGVLELSTGPWRFKYSNAPTLGRRGPWQKVPYTAY